MKGYNARPEEICGNCKHFCRHYIREEHGGYQPLWLGHCTHPRLKDRRAEEHCPHFSPKEEKHPRGL